MDKRGQGLSLNVIIVAALALIVLVVLVVVFTGRIGIFEKGLGQEGNSELIKLRTQYGDCHPGATSEAVFRNDFGQAESDNAKAGASAALSSEIDRCKALPDKDTCESADCTWK